ncbi:SWIM zinc finger family protein [Flavobacterium ustbae]|uniref:SWIM zinc finger family protein n=1 Tax=Flavobacterium ustbae TaxID=2488790 RepID=UPI000F79AB4D|nr:SWIM zinc finger family protein [Flavobacterium ustbae]
METEFIYQYKNPSYYLQEENNKIFSFSHNTEIDGDNNKPCFFYGNIINSYLASRCLSVLANTVSSHFALTPGQIAKLKDPIVSVGAGEIHFEAFSSCNSVYARINVLKNGVDGEFLHSGTTNIDFNNQTIRAFKNVQQSEKLLLGIGSKEVHVITEKHKTVENKVTLPNRWIKGLGNVQVFLSEMELAFQLTKFEALQLFKTLPTTPTKSEYYLTKAGANYTFLPLERPNSIKVGGIHRLNLIQKLISSVDSLFIYRHNTQQSFALILNFKDIQMTYLFSNSVYRGFSGEGRLLEDLTDSISSNLINGMNGYFKTNEVFNPTLISVENGIDLRIMNNLQSNLSGIGLLGYNLFDNNYFYRRLPFKLERLINFNPRLKNAKKIVECDEIKILERTETYIKALVKGSTDIYHTVIKNNEIYQCTCNWYTANENNRGLCKHILALKIALE